MEDLIIRALLGATLSGLIAAGIVIARLYSRVLIEERHQRLEWAKQRAAYRQLVERLERVEDVEWKLGNAA